MTLDELKRQNAETESAQQEEAQPVETEEVEVQAEVEEPEVDESATEDDGEETEAKEVPLWMQSEDQTSQESNGKQVPVKTHVAMKHKLKGRLQEKESENDLLLKKIEQLEARISGGQQQQNTNAQQTPLARPKLEDFDYDDDRYNQALDDYIDQKMSQKLTGYQQQNQQYQKQQQDNERFNKSVENHYERAGKLVDEGFLSAEEYRSSDSFVRQQIDSIRPGMGDNLTDAIISVLGEGSEKVMIALSRNQAYMSELQKELRDDPTGNRALVYLGGLKGSFNAVNRRVSHAPRPGRRVKGDATITDEGSKAKKAYNAAHKSGDRQKAFNIKREAKQAGINVREW